MAHRGILAGLAVVAAVLMVAIAIWTVVPAPTLPTLALAVLVPELAVPLVAIFALLATGCWFATRGRVRDELRALLAALTIPTLLVTHDEADRAAFPERVLRLAGGRIVEA